ncbi:response regulator transcription factor [Streptomyces sp. NPDC014748]|uniref:response regulator transcription factor n=1 Tax=Streptomyces sp. NPDC014748 TaxID=3364905 RepID=UPI0036F8BC6A
MADTRAFPWAVDLDPHRLASFIEDLWGAASGDNSLQTLYAIEQVIAAHSPTDPVASVPVAPLETARPVGPGPHRSPLTPREQQILTLYASGETKEAIGRALGISGDTVRTLCYQIRARLDAKNMAHAAAIGAHYGWLDGLRIPEMSKATRRPPKSWRRYYEKRASELRKRPGTEVLIGPYSTRRTAWAAAQRFRTGSCVPFRPAGSFATHLLHQGGAWHVLTTFVGVSADPTPEGAQL